MNITLSVDTFDTNGFIILRAARGTKITRITRRVSKTATLDGGSSVLDLGHSPSDPDYEIVVDAISLGDLEKLKDLVRLYPLVNMSNSEGYFKGVITDFTADEVPLRFTFSVKEKVL